MTSAISTIIAKGLGDTTLMSRPPLKTTSSSSPRVFINAPSDSGTRQDNPWRVPRRLPAIAVRMTIPQTAYIVPPEVSVSVVRAARHERADENTRRTRMHVERMGTMLRGTRWNARGASREFT